MITFKEIALDSKHLALDPVCIKQRFEVTHEKHAVDFMSRDEAQFLRDSGWQRRGMHTSGRTDMWAHPEHSPRATVAEEEVLCEEKRGERTVKWVELQDVERTRWRWFTREEALALEGRPTHRVVPKF